jgi:hypothetical protein
MFDIIVVIPDRIRIETSVADPDVFWTSWIRIRIHKYEIRIRLRILLQSCKNNKQNLNPYNFVTNLRLFT